MDTPAADEAARAFHEGNQRSGRKEWAEAARCYEQALAHDPQHEWAHNNLGFCLAMLGDSDRAALELKKALGIGPANTRALANLLMVIGEGEKRFEGIPYRRRLAQLEPHAAEHPFALAGCLHAGGCVSEAVFYYRRAMELAPEHNAAAINYLLAINYCEDLPPAFVAAEHFRVAQRWARQRSPADVFEQSRDLGRPLRIAYLSGDFSNHPVGKLIQPIMAAHDKSAFKVYAYSDSARDDFWTGRIRESCDAFVDVHGKPDDVLLARIRADRIDLLIEMTGYTNGHNRLGVIAAGAAPVQISFLGYPNTTGLAGMDYRLSDLFCDPPGRTESLHSERLVRLNRGFLCYRPPAELPPLRSASARAPGPVIFGSFNNPIKISPGAMAAWARILRETPESRLRINYFRSFASEWLRERWQAAFASQGVDPGRLEFLTGTPSVEDHLRMIDGVDVALDSFPYQGTMTTLETLAVGVPLVTMMGETYVRRTSSAILLRLGFDDLLTTNVDDYVSAAVALAHARSELGTLRSAIRERFLGSELCDIPAFVAELEMVYRQLWADWCDRK